jgi:hypothetical protein
MGGLFSSPNIPPPPPPPPPPAPPPKPVPLEDPGDVRRKKLSEAAFIRRLAGGRQDTILSGERLG